MSTDIRSELGAAADPESMCRLLRARCERFGSVDAIDLLPVATGDRGAVVCIVDMATTEQACAAQSGGELASFGASSLVCIVPHSRFTLPLPFHYAVRQPMAA